MHRIAATSLLAFLIAGQTCAAEPTVTLLWCDGTLTGRIDRTTPEPMEKMGVVVNLKEQTVSFLGYVARITDVDPANINFGGPQIGGPKHGYSISIAGNVDRVTGHMDAATTTSDPTKRPYDPNAVTFHYDVLCKVTNRVF
jgi:hypothetical protein